MASGLCTNSGGTCLASGACSCPPTLDSVADPATGFPVCVPKLNTQYVYIGITLRAVGYTLMGIIMTCCIAIAIWIAIFRKDRIIRGERREEQSD
jgi:hypothetical protein